MKDLTKLSEEALMTEWEKHSQAAADEKALAKECSEELGRRRAQEKIDAMSDDEKAALAQYLKPVSSLKGGK